MITISFEEKEDTEETSQPCGQHLLVSLASRRVVWVFLEVTSAKNQIQQVLSTGTPFLLIDRDTWNSISCGCTCSVFHFFLYL